ncbi:MarR family transcriptional regulator [Clostridium sp. 'White wine YQ']|uniref:MarR family transcriptional regulator n=1 Tax=Clostridium sp. 'White wine YQ' TaxID=3027474 RepID=UPI002366D563|nr:MarR family transcriptional regulator [Clostridium sp. 'White wine YQ']MDD7794248.1 MarR family transcriptional regulator [Clostridium sp. 'White wine YQ']
MNNKLGGLWISKINFLTGRIFTKQIKKNKSLKINHSQGRILLILSKFNDMTIINLCEELSVSKSTLTTMLDRLELNGNIEKKVNDLDKRSTLISITEKGRKYVGVYESIVTNMAKIYYKDFSEEEIEEFENYLARVYMNLKDADKEEGV